MTENNSIWAVQYRSYGGPEVLEIGRVIKPAVGPREVLVKTAAFSINRLDSMARQGRFKLFNGIGFPRGSGVDFSGVIAEVGSAVTLLNPGDRVWGYLGLKAPGSSAAAAEFVKVPAARVVKAPHSIDLIEAAALPLAGLTSIQGLQNTLRVQSGQQVLVIGGSGGVGSTAVQVARALGATVDAVAGPQQQELVRALGAATVYDYTTVKPGEITSRYHAIFDTVGASLLDYRRLLHPGGKIATIAMDGIPAILASVFSPGPRIRIVSGKPDAGDLEWLTSQVDTHNIHPVIERIFPLSEIKESHRLADIGHAAGKKVVQASELVTKLT